MYWTRFIAKSSASTNTTFGRDGAEGDAAEDEGAEGAEGAEGGGAEGAEGAEGLLPAVHPVTVTVTTTPIRHNNRLGPTRNSLRRSAAGVRTSSRLRGVGKRLRTRRGDRDYGPGL